MRSILTQRASPSRRSLRISRKTWLIMVDWRGVLARFCDSVCDGEVRAIYRSRNVAWIRLIDASQEANNPSIPAHEPCAFVGCLTMSATVAEDGEEQLPHHDSSLTKRATSTRPVQQVAGGNRDIRNLFVWYV